MYNYEIVITVFIAVLGACLASFVNAAALRKAAGESFTKGRSHCPHCKETLSWYELIPIVSYFIQLGKCRKCKADISIRYFFVELLGAIIPALCFLRFNLTWMTPLAFYVFFILMAITLLDYATMEIPNGLIIALIPAAIAAIWAQPEITLLARGIGFIAISLPMLILALVINGAFGGGDIKLMAVCGFLLGWQNTLTAFLIALILGGTVAVILMATGKAKKGSHIAFGPFLCTGVTTALLYGTYIIDWYLGLYGL